MYNPALRPVEGFDLVIEPKSGERRPRAFYRLRSDEAIVVKVTTLGVLAHVGFWLATVADEPWYFAAEHSPARATEARLAGERLCEVLRDTWVDWSPIDLGAV